VKSVLDYSGLVVLDEGLKSERYTSRQIHEIEQNLIAVTNRLKAERCEKIDIGKVDVSTMNAGQKAALDAILSGAQLSIVHGPAGTGKSFLLDKCRQVFEDAGYVLHGVCLQGKTAEDLEAGSSIKSGTLHSFLSKYDSGKIRINERSVIVLDEAGMVGSEQWNRLVSICDSTGAKLVAVGDTYQIQSVSYGSAFDQVSKIVGVSSLTEIMRQKTKWQNDASVSLSTHDVRSGLQAYDKNGKVHFEHDQLDAIDALAKRVQEDRRSGVATTSLVICKSNEERLELNKVIREGWMSDNGIVKSDGSFIVKKDGRKVELAEGEKIMFTAANRNYKVKNGTTATVSGIDEHNIHFDVDGRRFSVPHGENIELEQNWAVTINRSQGTTVSKAYVLASDIMSANDLYVAATRHKENLEIFTSHEHFDTIDTMIEALSDASEKSYTGETDEMQLDVNAIDRLAREQSVDALIAKDVAQTKTKTIDREIDLNDLLNRLAESHGLDVEKFGINREKNLIVCGSRELSATEFLSDEMALKMDWKEVALPYLRESYAQQIKGAHVERQKPTTREEMTDFKVYVKAREHAHEQSLKLLRQDARVIKNQIRDDTNILQAERDAQINQIQERLETEIANVERLHAKPNRILFEEFRNTEEQQQKRAALTLKEPAPESTPAPTEAPIPEKKRHEQMLEDLKAKRDTESKDLTEKDVEKAKATPPIPVRKRKKKYENDFDM